MNAKDGANQPDPTNDGYSWCCHMPVIQVGQHWECTECGAANASTTYHKNCTATLDRDRAMERREQSYMSGLLRGAA